jgi:hypothetical protein
MFKAQTSDSLERIKKQFRRFTNLRKRKGLKPV